jgi:hypothetical protein
MEWYVCSLSSRGSEFYEDGLKALGTLDYIFFAGAPLNSESGDKISKVTKMVTVNG